MKNVKMNAEELRMINNDLTPQERKVLRTWEEWESCLTAYLDSTHPKLVREQAQDPEKTRVFLDGKTLQLLRRKESGEAETEIMPTLFPMWQEASEEEAEEEISPEEHVRLQKLLSPTG
jgi:hypothetical protein